MSPKGVVQAAVASAATAITTAAAYSAAVVSDAPSGPGAAGTTIQNTA